MGERLNTVVVHPYEGRPVSDKAVNYQYVPQLGGISEEVCRGKEAILKTLQTV